MNFIVGFQGMRKFYVFAFFSMLTMISGCAVFDGRNASVDDGKIVAGDALPSAQHESDDSSDVKEVADNTSSETSASKDESKTASVESKLVDNSADEPDNTSKDASENRPQVLEEETKPLVEKITEETPDETRKMPEIRYLSDEEFIASMEQVGSAKTTPVETEELDITSILLTEARSLMRIIVNESEKSYAPPRRTTPIFALSDMLPAAPMIPISFLIN